MRSKEWLMNYICNLFDICCQQTSWRGFITVFSLDIKTVIAIHVLKVLLKINVTIANRKYDWCSNCISTFASSYNDSCVFSSRDVVLQERARLVQGKPVVYLKPRVTHDMSSVPKELGGRKQGTSANSGT